MVKAGWCRGGSRGLKEADAEEGFYIEPQVARAGWCVNAYRDSFVGVVSWETCKQLGLDV